MAIANDKTNITLGTMTIKAAADLPANRFVNALGNLCSAGGHAIGVTTKSYKAGQNASICFSGIVAVEAGGVINNAGNEVVSDAQGRAVTTSSAIQKFITLDRSTMAGTFIRVRL